MSYAEAVSGEQPWAARNRMRAARPEATLAREIARRTLENDLTPPP